MSAAFTDLELKRAIEQAGAISGLALGLAVGLDALIGIDLPPGAETQIDQAQMRAIASLYLAADLESAGVLPAVETLAGLSRAAGLPVDVGAAAPLLQAFWKNRNERATPAERAAFFAQLFGIQVGAAPATGAVNAAFEDVMLDLCEALYKLDELAVNATYGGVAQQARVRTAAQALAGNLVRAGGAITAFMAEDILQALREALAILASADLRAALGARDTWAAIGAVRRLNRQPGEDPALYARRGKAGMTVLAWLAEAGPHLADPGQPLVALDHPVITAAVEWLEAALAIGETVSPPPPQPHYAPAPASPWAAIGA